MVMWVTQRWRRMRTPSDLDPQRLRLVCTALCNMAALSWQRQQQPLRAPPPQPANVTALAWSLLSA